eukprot:m.143073 g.143073  ORF g.143073 m.143073 type:complete len:508 (+) comp38378_c0_seq4:46-1569(+)
MWIYSSTFIHLIYIALANLSLGFAALLWFRRSRKRPSDVIKTTPIFRSPLSNADRSKSTQADVVVVGCGIVGSALAASLARDGRNVVAMERDLKEPNRIVGELLQPGGVRALRKLDLEECLEGLEAQTTTGYVIHDVETNSQIHIPYPVDGDGMTLAGRAFHHGRFIMALRRAAMQEKNVTMIEGTVVNLITENDRVVGVQYRQKESDGILEVFSSLTIVCDGCFSKFRRGLVEATVSVPSHFVGLIMHDCNQFKHRHAELVLSQKFPSLVYKIGPNETRVLVDIQGKLPSDIKSYLRTTVAPNFPDHLHGPFLDAVNTQTPRSMPNSFLPPCSLFIPGVVALGDAFNMRHPLTGGGMTVGLSDVVLWKGYVSEMKDLGDASELLNTVKRFQWERKGAHSFVVNVLAQALYQLFSAADADLNQLRRACFAYFRLGGRAVSGPVGLLSILSPNAFVLIGHFFAVALYAVYFSFADEKWAIHRGLWKASRVFLKACKVIFPLIWSERHL